MASLGHDNSETKAPFLGDGGGGGEGGGGGAEESPVGGARRKVLWKPGLLVVDTRLQPVVDDNHDNHADQQWPVTLVLSNGETVGCDFLVSATGVVPNAPFLGSEFARSAVDGGITVNRRLQTPVRTYSTS